MEKVRKKAVKKRRMVRRPKTSLSLAVIMRKEL